MDERKDHLWKVAQEAEDERSKGARRAAQRVEEAEGAALAVVAHELGDGAVEDGGRAIKRHARRDEQQHRPGQRRDDHRRDQQAGGQLGENDGAQDADALGDKPAHELARCAADEYEGQSEADTGHARTLGDEQEREEGEEARAAGAVDELDGTEQREARGIGEPQPTSGAGAAFAGARGVPSARLASATSVTSPTPTTMRP